MADDSNNTITSIDLPLATYAFARVSATTDHLSTAFDTMKKCLDEKYGCWGRDDTGNQFANQYVKNANDYIQNGEDLRTQLQQNATDLRGVPGQFTEADQQNADNIG